MMVRVRVMRGARREKPTWEDGEMGRWGDGEAARCRVGAKVTVRVGRCQADGKGCEAREAELSCKGWSVD